MVHESPAWCYQAQHSLTLGYGHVHLLPEHVLGQWFCVERASGRALWDRAVCQADSVLGVSEGVIIASETRMSGPCTYTHGVFAIGLDTGEMLWTSHTSPSDGRGFVGALMKWFGIATEDHAAGVRGSECITGQGRVLDVHTGRELRRESPSEDWPAFWKAKSLASNLYSRHPVEIAPGKLLQHGLPEAQKKEGGFPDGTFTLFLSDAQGSPFWSFDLAATGHHIRGNFYSYRYSNGYVYMVVSDRPQSVPVDLKKPMIVKDNPANYFLWTLDAVTGQVCQKIPLTEQPTTHCRLEDLDDGALVVSCGQSAMLFPRS